MLMEDTAKCVQARAERRGIGLVGGHHWVLLVPWGPYTVLNIRFHPSLNLLHFFHLVACVLGKGTRLSKFPRSLFRWNSACYSLLFDHYEAPRSSCWSRRFNANTKPTSLRLPRSCAARRALGCGWLRLSSIGPVVASAFKRNSYL